MGPQDFAALLACQLQIDDEVASASVSVSVVYIVMVVVDAVAERSLAVHIV